MNYYNEIDPYAAQWLRNLIADGQIPAGHVDERSIVDVTPADLVGYVQAHFFAGIGGWPIALRLAGWPDDKPVWTGSCPCQPFSVAGKGQAQSDERHLWPHWFRLIAAVRPSVVFGEQVAGAIAHGWLDDAFDDLEREGYETGTAVLPACSVGAPHKRDRLWFIAHRSGDGRDKGKQDSGRSGQGVEARAQCGLGDGGSIMADTASQQDNAERRIAESGRQPLGRAWEAFSKWQASNNRTVGHGEIVSDSDNQGLQGRNGAIVQKRSREQFAREICPSLANTNSIRELQPKGSVSEQRRRIGYSGEGRYENWDSESGICRLANGIPARAHKLRAYGNAIVPQVAAEFIKAAMHAL